LLKRFFDDALETVFEYRGIMGEFSGDKFMAIFGMPLSQSDDADRAVLAAIAIHDNARELNRLQKHHLRFEIGIGVSTGGPIWIGDIGSDWRRELTMIGTTINVASRVEELTKTEEFWSVTGDNIILTEATVDNLSSEIRKCLQLKAFPARQLRGLGEARYRLFKLIGHDQSRMPVLRGRIYTATQAVVDAIAQTIESVQEREEAVRLELTMQEIGQAISSSLKLEEILGSVMDGIQKFLHATTASLVLIEEGSNRLRFKAVRPEEYLPVLKPFEEKLVVGTGIVGHVAETGESLCLDDAQTDSRFYSQPDTRTGFQTRSVLCTPIRLEGAIIGVIQVIDSQAGRFSMDDLRVLEAIAAFTASAIRNARHAEDEMLAAMSVVTTDIAHRIKSDVGLIQFVSQSLLDKSEAGGLDATFLRSKLERINGKTKQIIEMMNEIRDPFSGFGLGEVDLRDLLESALESVLAKTPQGALIDVQRRYQELPLIVTDKARLSAVFFKIIENALEAMGSSSRKVLTIEVWQSEPSRVRIGIADTGPGIPPDDRARLFRPRLQRSDSKRGSGVGGWGYGLWSSSLSVRNLGGAIFLDEVYSDGTRMIIDLPLVAKIQP
jgi:signal transduction histidine kinase/class 3 adenylate cyclase